MECKSAQTLIDGYLDNELDLMGNTEMDDHLRGCIVCSQMYRDQRALRDAVRSPGLYFSAPDELRHHVQASLRQAAAVRAPSRKMSWQWIRIAAPVAAAVVIALTLVPIFRVPSAVSITAQEVVSSHIRSLMADHLADVPSSDKHTVKPWFDGKLDFAPPVEDLASQGFPLVGGRLDYVNNRPVAALIYRRRKHYINLFVWPSTQKTSNEGAPVTVQGYHVFHWEKAGMVYWTVSDLEESELEKFVQILQGHSGSLT
jgi:anti-sigma factor RsiW